MQQQERYTEGESLQIEAQTCNSNKQTSDIKDVAASVSGVGPVGRT